MKVIFFLLVGALFLPVLATDYTDTKNLSISSEGIDKLVIDCGAGYLNIVADENTDQINVTAKIEVQNINPDRIENLLEKYLVLSLKPKGSTAELISSFETSKSFFSALFNPGANVKVDLKVEIPKELDIVIDDGSGYINIRDVQGNIRIDDGSGSIIIHDIRGRLDIDDGSGEIDIENTIGEIYIDDGSGDISINNVQGDLIIDDGTGEIILNDIDGNVRLDDGSGSIHIDGVEEDVVIENSGSGSVKIKNVAGNVRRYDD